MEIYIYIYSISSCSRTVPLLTGIPWNSFELLERTCSVGVARNWEFSTCETFFHLAKKRASWYSLLATWAMFFLCTSKPSRKDLRVDSYVPPSDEAQLSWFLLLVRPLLKVEGSKYRGESTVAKTQTWALLVA